MVDSRLAEEWKKQAESRHERMEPAAEGSGRLIQEQNRALKAIKDGIGDLSARGKSSAAFKRRCIPAELCCSSVEYASSPRLVSQAQRRLRCYAGRSRCYAGFHHGLS